MNKLRKGLKCRSSVITYLLANSIALAQDSKMIINDEVEVNAVPFYYQLWFWVIIGLLFLLFLITLLRSKDDKKRK